MVRRLGWWWCRTMPSLTTTNEATPSHLSCVGRGLVPNTNYSNILHLSPRIYCYKYLNRLCRCRVCPNGASGSTFFVVLGQAPIFCRLIYNHTHKTRFKLELDSIFFLLSSVRARYVLTISFGTAHFGIITQKREIFQAQIGLRFGLVF